MAKKKQSKKHKQWLRDRNHIEAQKNKPLKDKIMGNVKEACYTCTWAGYYIEYQYMDFYGIQIKVPKFIPYCRNPKHIGRLANISINKWNDKFEERTKKFEDKVINNECFCKKASL